MKTNIINIHGRYVVKTGKVFVYETNNVPVFDKEEELVDYDELSYSDEIIDICTGEHFGFDGVIHKIGNPIDAYYERQNPSKRGRHSRSHNKQSGLLVRRVLPWEEDLPF